MHGNTLYEWSQMLAAVGDASWKSVLDEAAGLFRTAGCAEKDIRAALKNHTEVRRAGPVWLTQYVSHCVLSVHSTGDRQIGSC
jgi:hypothetical protein